MVHLTVLTENEVKVIHQATLRILDEVGIVLTQPYAREILSGEGAKIQGEFVHIPSDLIEKNLRLCPKMVTLHSRGGSTVTLGDGNLHWHNLGGAPYVYESTTSIRRPATLQDVRDSALLLDALDHVNTIVPTFTPQDVPAPLIHIAMYRTTLANTSKPVQGPGVTTANEVRTIAQMASVIGPPQGFLSLSVSPLSPLTFGDETVLALMEIAEWGIPFAPLPCPIAGATAPMSLSGALAQQNAELLASIALAQSIRPGLPTIYCGRLSVMDPRSGLSVWGGLETGLASAASIQLGHRYGLPVNVYGFCTNAHGLNLQNGYERTINAVTPALAGADELSGIGELDSGMMSSYTQMICDNEIAGSIHRLIHGISVDDRKLAVELIGEVMQDSRQFIDQWHTAQTLRAGEVFIPTQAERSSWEEWDRAGRDDMVLRAQQEANKIISTHEVLPMTERQEQDLDALFRQAEETSAEVS
jgi:trimethylamine--corrinoid protein Co-methyltransferase